MLFNFDHTDKMVAQSVDASHNLSNNEAITVKIPADKASDINISGGDELLVLATTTTKSVLLKTVPVSEPNGWYMWMLDSDVIKYLDSDDTSITLWTTNIDKIDDISVDNLPMGDDIILGDSKDPTGGTDLFIRTRDVKYNESKQNFTSSFRIPAEPYRQWLDLPDDSEITFKFSRADNSTTPTTSDARSLSSDGVTAYTTKEIRDEVNLTKEHNVLNIWATTTSIAESEPSTQTNEGVDKPTNGDEPTDDTSKEKVESHLSEVQNNNDSADPKQSTVQTGDKKSQKENGNRTKNKTASTTQSNDDKSVDDIQDQAHRIPLHSKTIDTEVNPDLTPVVLLDDDERTQKNSTGHYKKDENDELLCGKDYTKAVADPQREHYSVLCKECLEERPGALSEEDIAAIFERITGSNFTDELPIMLDRKKAAEVITAFSTLLEDSEI